MKHYIKENSRVWDVPVFGNEQDYTEEHVRNAKRFYRKRERAALRRMVEETVVEELGTPSQLPKWERELAEAKEEFFLLCQEEDWDRWSDEHDGTEEYDPAYYEREYQLIRARIEKAEKMLAVMAA